MLIAQGAKWLAKLSINKDWKIAEGYNDHLFKRNLVLQRNHWSQRALDH